MAEGFTVDPSQLHRHAANVRAVRDQLTAIRDASRAIAQNDAAYGLLCAWIAAILEHRHVSQDKLYAFVGENLELAAKALTAAADGYDATDRTAQNRIRQAGGIG